MVPDHALKTESFLVGVSEFYWVQSVGPNHLANRYASIKEELEEHRKLAKR